jgi:hypothetical protein
MPTTRRSRPAPIAARIMLVGTVLVIAWLVYGQWDQAQRDPGPAALQTEFTVDGLDCPVWCSVRMMDAIDGLDGAHLATIDREHGRVIVRHDPARQPAHQLRRLLEQHGFPVTGTAARAAIGK